MVDCEDMLVGERESHTEESNLIKYTIIISHSGVPLQICPSWTVELTPPQEAWIVLQWLIKK